VGSLVHLVGTVVHPVTQLAVGETQFVAVTVVCVGWTLECCLCACNRQCRCYFKL